MTTTLCAKCGACTAVCPVYQVTGQESLTARGRLHLLEKLAGTKPSKEYIEIFSRCLLCNACKAVCPRGIDLPSMVAAARREFPALSGKRAVRKKLIEKCLAHDRLLKSIASVLKLSQPIMGILPADSGLRLKLGLMAEKPGRHPHPSSSPPPSRDKSPDGFMLFKGCLATHIHPGIASACDEMATKSASGTYSPPQHCCGVAAFSSGDLKTARELARKNITAFEPGGTRILTPCASCYSHLRTYPELFADDPGWHTRAVAFANRLTEFSTYLSTISNALPATGSEKEKKQRVLYHDPCHLRFRPGDYVTPPRQLLTRRKDVDLVELPRGPRCCGLGGLFNLIHPDLSDKIASELLLELEELQPDIIVTTCSGCLLQLKFLLAGRKDLQVEVIHLAEFLNS